MRLEFSDDPRRAFGQLRVAHFVIAAHIFVIALAGEGLVAANDGRTVDLEINQWVLRLVAAVYGVSLLAPLILMKESQITAKGMKSEPGRPDFVVKGALEAIQLMRSAFSTMPAILGVILILLSGERLDLYIPLAASALLLFLTRPTRRHWEETFASASRDYRGVSISPWATA